MASQIRKDDFGTVFNATVLDGGTAVDISTTTKKEFVFEKPNKTLLTVDGTFNTDGTDGKMRYTTVSGDLNDAGNWSVQTKFTFASTFWTSDVFKFKVHENL